MQRDKLTLDQRLAIIRETAEPIKKLAAEDKIVGFLSDTAFKISFNANDTFGYACADAVDVVIEDLPKLLEVHEKFGHDGVTAFLALVEECDVLTELKTERYLLAVEYLKDYRPCSWVM